MVTYLYICHACGHHVELAVQKYELIRCPECLAWECHYSPEQELL